LKEKGKIILITGASSGIGRALAFICAENKYSIIATYFSNKNKTDSLAEKCLKLGAKDIQTFYLDQGDDKSIRKFVKEVEKKYEGIDILVNNAAVVKRLPLIETTTKDIREQIGVNLSGPIMLTSLLLPKIKEKIVNIGSSATKEDFPNMNVYTASKYGIIGFSKCLAKENKGIHVSVVHPHSTKTQITNFERGILPKEAAQVIFNVITGELEVESGGEVNIRDILKY